MIYGATGYMGHLTTRLFLEAGMKPLLAARDEKVKLLADEKGLNYRVFSLDDQRVVNKNLSGISVLINLAGSFNLTNEPLVEGCLANKAHYLDISGEVTVFETVLSYDVEARRAGVMLMPGVGFGIVPTDVMALHLQQLLPEANKLILAFATRGGVSQGTMKAGLKGIHKAGVIRVNGELETSLAGEKSIHFTAENEEIKAVTNPWRGDLVTAFITTGIPNIETYTAFPGPLVMIMKNPKLFGWLMQSRLMDAIISSRPAGPDEKVLKEGKSYVYGKSTSMLGTQRESVMIGPEAYLFSAMTTIEISKRILNGEFKAGFQTPAGFYGTGIVDGMVKIIDT